MIINFSSPYWVVLIKLKKELENHIVNRFYHFIGNANHTMLKSVLGMLWTFTSLNEFVEHRSKRFCALPVMLNFQLFQPASFSCASRKVSVKTVLYWAQAAPVLKPVIQ